MRILAHRGLWPEAGGPNSLRALAGALDAGHGIELDVRDLGGSLIVSHDPPTSVLLTFDEVVATATRFAGVLAVNVKADGLHDQLAAALDPLPEQQWFTFDHSVPDLRTALAHGIRCFTRQSDLEPVPTLVEHAAGVWIDGFERDWVAERTVAEHLEAGRQVCLVSPELHGRQHRQIWAEWARWPVATADEVMICTDFPNDAAEVFRR